MRAVLLLKHVAVTVTVARYTCSVKAKQREATAHGLELETKKKIVTTK